MHIHLVGSPLKALGMGRQNLKDEWMKCPSPTFYWTRHFVAAWSARNRPVATMHLSAERKSC